MASVTPELQKLDDTGLFDITTFNQILEMDDDPEEREFSKSIVFDFFDQAESTFGKMEQAVQDKDLTTLSQLGHFLKGSSATLGLTHVKNSCEKIQHLGSRKDETGTNSEPDDVVSLSRLKDVIEQAKSEYEEARALLEEFYKE